MASGRPGPVGSTIPSRFAGVRPYTPGDSVRRIHWRATARLGEPVVKRFDPARERDVVIVLDVDTQPADQATPRGSDVEAEHDRFEELCIVAASLARRFEADGAACGLAAANFTGGRRIAFAAPSSAAGQSGRLGDLLARLGDDPSAPFPALLSGMTRLARPGTQLVIVSARDPRPSLAAARGLARSGFGIELVALGDGRAGPRPDRPRSGHPCPGGSARRWVEGEPCARARGLSLAGTGLTWPDVLGSALVGLSEGAWITVLYVLIETVGHADSPLGLPIFAGVAFLGALAGPRLDQLGEGAGGS